MAWLVWVGFAFEKRGEVVELSVPESGIAIQPGLGVMQRPMHQSTFADAAHSVLTQQAGPFEDAEVLADGRGGHSERPGEVADEGRSAGEAIENRPASGVGERGKGGVQFA